MIELAVVHNGVIENYAALKKPAPGRRMQVSSSDTDTEVISPSLVQQHYDGDLVEAVGAKCSEPILKRHLRKRRCQHQATPICSSAPAWAVRWSSASAMGNITWPARSAEPGQPGTAKVVFALPGRPNVASCGPTTGTSSISQSRQDRRHHSQHRSGKPERFEKGEFEHYMLDGNLQRAARSPRKRHAWPTLRRRLLRPLRRPEPRRPPTAPG